MHRFGANRSTLWGSSTLRSRSAEILRCVNPFGTQKARPSLRMTIARVGSVEGDTGLLGNIAQIFDNRQDQWHTIFAAALFGFAFRIAGNERPLRARSRLGRAKDADVIVNPALEGIAVDEAVDLHGAKEMTDAIADATAGNFLAKGKGRREWSPIRAAKNAAQDVHHNGEAVAFVSAAFAVGTERQQRAAVDHGVWIGRIAALAVDRPAFGN